MARQTAALDRAICAGWKLGNLRARRGWRNGENHRAKVIVENRPGTAGNIAMQEVALSTDEHTLILGHIGTLAVNPYIFAKLPYDANRDFVPITLVSKVPSLYVVHPDLPVKNLSEFVAYTKSKPGQLNYGSAGNGSAGHLAFEYLKMVSNTFVLHVPYRGTGPMLTDLMAGRLQAASVGAPALLQFIKAGKLRCIATGTAQRLPHMPDVPTVAEQGFAGFEMTQWYGLLAPCQMAQGEHCKIRNRSHQSRARQLSERQTRPRAGACRGQHGR